MTKKIFSSAGYLAGASLIEKIGGIILIPILTSKLAPEKYGELALALTYIGFISLFFYNGLHSALFRWYSMWSESFDKRIYEKYIFYIINIIGLIVLFALSIVNYFIYNLEIFLQVEFSLFIFAYLSSLVLVGYSLRGTVWIIENKPQLNLYFMTLKTLFTVGIVYFFIDSYTTPYIRPIADILSIGLSSFMIYYYYIVKYPPLNSIRYSQIRPVLKESFIYGWGLQISQLSFWVINSSDRVMLAHLIDNKSVALYSVLMLGTTAIFLVVAFNNSFSAYYNKMLHEHYSINILNSYISKYLLYGFIAVLLYKFVLYFFAENIILLLSTKDYLSISSYLYLTSDLIFFYFTYLLFSRYFHAHKMVKLVIAITLSSAILNVVLNFIFIPIYGIFGALIGSLISYFFMAFISLFLLYKKQGLSNIQNIVYIFLVTNLVNIVCDLFMFGDFV